MDIDELLKQERVKVFMPSEDLVWVSAEIATEIKPGHYDPDYKVTKATPARMEVSLKKLKLESLPLQNVELVETGIDDMKSHLRMNCSLDRFLQM